MMGKIQRFGAAMFTPVLLFSFFGLILAISIVCKNPMLVGSIANEGTLWYKAWSVVESGGWTVFNQMELLFVIGLPLGLAKMEKGRAALESVVVYAVFNYFLSSLLQNFGTTFGVDFEGDVGGVSGMKMILGIKTLDTSIIGAIFIGSVVVWLHNRYFEKKLPDYLGIFQGSSYITMIGFFVMIPLAVLTAFVWPVLQGGIVSLQGLLSSSGVVGVWFYTFLERILIPTGLHHFIYTPFVFGPAVVEGGISRYWLENLNDFSQLTEPLKNIFPGGGFSLHGNSKMFGAIGIALAFYFTAHKSKQKKVLSILIPVTLTAFLAGITEPLEFTFLFIAPVLFAVHALLAATMSALMFAFGLVGNMGGGFIDLLAQNWLPLWHNHWLMYVWQIVIGVAFIGIYFIVFRFLILKMNLATPGREEPDKDIKLYSKAEYKKKVKAEKEEQKLAGKKSGTSKQEDAVREFIRSAEVYLEALGGPDNIQSVNNCATRLRVAVKDPELVRNEADFKVGGAHGLLKQGVDIQVIVGLSVPQVRSQFEKLLK